ncbi:MAG: aspartate kinase [Pirellulales bacterium]|nr:aspartate kinase [Pirellulales bacterium]
MPLIVQKFGGTSVADVEKISSAARKAVRARQEGHQVVVVVSAMGKNTDELIRLANEVTDNPPAREMDMLLSTGEQVSVALMAMAVTSMGYEAVSLTGAQIGIRTDSTHTKARIHSISTDRIRKALSAGKIVIAAGFQGIDEEFNITTLGRGGSDTTAVALAAVLGAEQCQIYTDVDGVYTTDPRILPEARMVRQVSNVEMLELASMGAGVMHSRSIEFGKKFNVAIHVRNAAADIPGTLIVNAPESKSRAVSGAACVRDEARVTLRGVPDEPGTSHTIFSRIASQNVPVDMIVQNVGDSGRVDVSFTVLLSDLPATLEAVQKAGEKLDADEFTFDRKVSKVSVVGLGMAQQTGVATRMFQAIADAGTSIQMITTSDIKISALVSREDHLKALRAAHAAFELHVPPPDADPNPLPPPVRPRDAVDVVERLRGMEDLTVDGIACEENQSRVTIAQVPDVPGTAARIFAQIADQDVFVDMIVQSCGRDDRVTDLSFTIPQPQLERCLAALDGLSRDFGCGSISHAPWVSKLTVSGIGMRNHTSVAIRMFEALASAGINLEMVNSSEVSVNIVVDGEKKDQGMNCLREAFADARQ